MLNILTKKVTKKLYLLRFILPCKSDCQPIFLKMQGTYSLYAKLRLERPLIKQNHDFSPRYLSNVTFGTSLAFPIRDKFVLKKEYFLKVGPPGRKIVALCNFTRNICMCLDIFELRIENKK